MAPAPIRSGLESGAAATPPAVVEDSVAAFAASLSTAAQHFGCPFNAEAKLCLEKTLQQAAGPWHASQATRERLKSKFRAGVLMAVQTARVGSAQEIEAPLLRVALAEAGLTVPGLTATQ